MSRESTSGQDRLNQVLAQYLEALEPLWRDPQAVQSLRERYLADHLDLAADLERHFEDEDAVGSGLGRPEILPVLDRYTGISHIGQGAMGAVYKAFDGELRRWVALKMSLSRTEVTSAEARRFRMEAQSMARLKHPNIVRVFDVTDCAGRTFLSMELVSGGSLDVHLDRFRAQPEAAARLMVRIARGVHHAHERGILHRDLKPSNILLDTDGEGPGQPHVSDFGLAKPIDSEESTAGRRLRPGPGTTEYGKIVGTASYMAPEQAMGRDATTLSDVYGLGGILYALLTGGAPFRGDSVEETLEQVRAPGPPVPPRALNPAVDPTLEAICLKCLEKEPENRYRSAEELAKELDRWLGHWPTEARPPNAFGRFKLWGHRRPLGVGLIGVLAVLVALIAWNIYDRLEEPWRVQGEIAVFQARTIQQQLEPLSAAVFALAGSGEVDELAARRDWDGLQSHLMLRAAGIEVLGESPFESCYFIDAAGFIKARWPEIAEQNTDFRNRDYYRKAAAEGRTGASRVFYSVSDDFYKFAAAARVVHAGELAGVLACSVTTTADIGVTRMEDLGFINAVLAARDESRVQGEAESENFLSRGASNFVVFSHPLYQRGERPALLPQAYVDEHRDIFEDGANGCVDDYIDPVGELNLPGAEDYRGSWNACFARVNGTDFIVVVQRSR